MQRLDVAAYGGKQVKEPLDYGIVETRLMMRKVASALAYSFLVCSAASAQDWASKMFQTTTHDFGKWLVMIFGKSCGPMPTNL
jgi:hypothetical protein